MSTDDEDRCPVCERPEECRGYPHLWRRLREDRARWMPVHDLVNDVSTHRGDVVVEYPPATTMAMNAAKSMVGFVASGFATASDEERSRRMATCEACEHFDAGPRRCRVCGCFASLKARIEREHCPVNKW